MKPQLKGSVFGGILLITGSCVGSGMLALPVVTGIAGLGPSLVMFFLAWAFMTTTALFLVEVNGWFTERVNYISMVTKVLGRFARFICWITYLLLFYSLLVAYIALSGQHFSSLFSWLFSMNISSVIASIFFVCIFGWLVLMGTRYVDFCNRWLMLLKILAFLFLVGFGSQYVEIPKLQYVDIKYSLFSLPLLIISFGFHNMIPSLNHYLGGDSKRVKQAIIGGSLFTFAIYIIWEVIALGILPQTGPYGFTSALKKGSDAAQVIKEYMQASEVGYSAQILALFAILTSFLAQTLSLAHFLGDGLRFKNKDSLGLVVLALAPPLMFEVINPHIFYQSLKFAGGICAVILFGILPAMMIWKGRYQLKLQSTFATFGGRLWICLIGFFALFIFIYQISSMLGFDFFPHP